MSQSESNEKWWTAPTPAPAPAPAYVSPLMAMILQQQQPNTYAAPPPVEYAPAPAPSMQQPYQGGMYAPKNYYNTATPFSTGQAPYSGQGTYMPPTTPLPSPVAQQNAAVYARMYGAQSASFNYSDWYRQSFGAGMGGVQAQTQGNQAMQRLAEIENRYGGNPLNRGVAIPGAVGNGKPPPVNWWDDPILRHQMLVNPAALPPPKIKNQEGAPVYGGGGYGGWYGGGGYGGGGNYESQSRWWLNPSVWRI